MGGDDMLQKRTGIKPLRAAAFALMSWYLLMPPRLGGPSAPLSEWVNIKADFESLDECKQAREVLVNSMNDPATGESFRKEQGGTEADRASFASALKLSQCVSDADPRLKGNSRN